MKPTRPRDDIHGYVPTKLLPGSTGAATMDALVDQGDGSVLSVWLVTDDELLAINTHREVLLQYWCHAIPTSVYTNPARLSAVPLEVEHVADKVVQVTVLGETVEPPAPSFYGLPVCMWFDAERGDWMVRVVDLGAPDRDENLQDIPFSRCVFRKGDQLKDFYKKGLAP